MYPLSIMKDTYLVLGLLLIVVILVVSDFCTESAEDFHVTINNGRRWGRRGYYGGYGYGYGYGYPYYGYGYGYPYSYYASYYPWNWNWRHLWY